MIDNKMPCEDNRQLLYDEMYRIVGLDRNKVISVLREHIKELIFDSDFEWWTPEKPTLGCCGLLTALAYCYTPLYPSSFTCVIDYFDKDTKRQEHHWIICIPIDNIQVNDKMFIQYINHRYVVVVDLSMEQYADDDINYMTAKPCHFQWPSPNNKVKKLAEYLGLTKVRDGFRKMRNYSEKSKDFFEF